MWTKIGHDLILQRDQVKSLSQLSHSLLVSHMGCTVSVMVIISEAAGAKAQTSTFGNLSMSSPWRPSLWARLDCLYYLELAEWCPFPHHRFSIFVEQCTMIWTALELVRSAPVPLCLNLSLSYIPYEAVVVVSTIYSQNVNAYYILSDRNHSVIRLSAPEMV